MVEQPQGIENNTVQEGKDRQKNRAKATFSLLDHFVKVYNNAETYIKRSLTLFGLGSIIAGASFSVGQRLPSNEVTLPKSSSSTNTSSNFTSQPIDSKPQIIYVTPPPNQPITSPHPEPTKTTSVESEPIVTSSSSPSETTPANRQPEPIVTSSSSPSETTPANRQPEPLVTPPSIDSLPVPKQLSEVKQTVDFLLKERDD